MANDWPVLVLTLTIWTYWGTVLLLVLYKRLRYGQGAGVIPRHRGEKRLWRGILPVFLAWNTFPLLAASLQHGPFSLPTWADSVPTVYGFRCASALLGVVCYLGTLSCWLVMGRNWSMAIVPGQKTELVTGGLFGWVRHPIYSLSIVLMICSAVAVPTVPMFLLAVLHVTFMNIKAKKEEGHLAATHGPSYRLYCDQVGRFVPRVRGVAAR